MIKEVTLIVATLVGVALLHELGHIVMLQGYDIPYKRKWFTIKFNTDRQRCIKIAIAGIIAGLLPLLYLSYYNSFVMVMALLIWYLVGCIPDIKTIKRCLKDV